MIGTRCEAGRRIKYEKLPSGERVGIDRGPCDDPMCDRGVRSMSEHASPSIQQLYQPVRLSGDVFVLFSDNAEQVSVEARPDGDIVVTYPERMRGQRTASEIWKEVAGD